MKFSVGKNLYFEGFFPICMCATPLFYYEDNLFFPAGTLDLVNLQFNRNVI